jgi:glycosyltransferase involved in cell wall biosynthesis
MKIGLCMIVKNEAALIERCLNSVRPLIDFVLIEDNGSTDGTQDIIRNWLDQYNIPGRVLNVPWHDFGSNRTHVLATLRTHTEIDYAFMMDADDIVVIDSNFDLQAWKANLTADLYSIEIRLANIRFYRSQLFSNKVDFVYRGVLHEYLVAPQGCEQADVSGFYIAARVEGSRSQDPNKYRKDAVLLTGALDRETDPFLRSRYTFYLAQSWRDCGESKLALDTYLKRAELEFWDQEIFISLYRAGQLMEQLKYPGYVIIGMYLKAWQICPTRAESLHAVARYSRLTNQFQIGYTLAKKGMELFEPKGALFSETWIYDYGMQDEFAINAYYTGYYKESRDACLWLLRISNLPDSERSRVTKNLQFAQEKLT